MLLRLDPSTLVGMTDKAGLDDRLGLVGTVVSSPSLPGRESEGGLMVKEINKTFQDETTLTLTRAQRAPGAGRGDKSPCDLHTFTRFADETGGSYLLIHMKSGVWMAREYTGGTTACSGPSVTTE